MSHLVEWVKALESEEYEQTTGTLRGAAYRDKQGDVIDKDIVERPDGYCCLGVAAKLCPFVTEKDDGFEYYSDDDGEVLLEDGELGPEVRAWLGINDERERRYIALNDDRRRTFKEIAAEVRADYPEAFAKLKA